MKTQQPWIHKTAWATAQGHLKNEKAHEDRVHNNKERKDNCCWKGTEWSTEGQKAQVCWFRWGRWRTSKWAWKLLKLSTCTSTSFQLWWWRQWVQRPIQCTKSGLRKEFVPPRSLRSDLWWALDNDTLRHTNMQQQLDHFVFSMSENGDQQDICNLITMPCVQQSLYLNGATNDFDNMKVEVPKRVDGQTKDMLERRMVTCGRAARTRAQMRSRARKEASAQEVRGYGKQFAEAKHLEYKPWVDNEVFWSHRHEEGPAELCDQTMGAHHQDGQARQLPQSEGQMGIKRFQDKQKEYLQTDSPASNKTRIWDELPNGSQQGMESFSYWFQNSFFFKDNPMMWTVMLCVNFHQKHVILLTLLQDWRNLHMASMRPPDAGGTSLTRPCVAIAWFPRELIDVVTCCTQYSRVNEPWTKGTFHSGTIQATSQINRVCGQKWMLHMRKCWIPLQEVQLQRNPVAGIINLFVDDLFGTGGIEMEQRVLSQT